jgi:hypothetical protein
LETVDGLVHRAILDVTGLREALPERGHKVGPLGSGRGVKESDHRHRRLLRARREWPRSRAAEQLNELAPPTHSKMR